MIHDLEKEGRYLPGIGSCATVRESRATGIQTRCSSSFPTGVVSTTHDTLVDILCFGPAPNCTLWHQAYTLTPLIYTHLAFNAHPTLQHVYTNQPYSLFTQPLPGSF